MTGIEVSQLAAQGTQGKRAWKDGNDSFYALFFAIETAFRASIPRVLTLAPPFRINMPPSNPAAQRNEPDFGGRFRSCCMITITGI